MKKCLLLFLLGTLLYVTPAFSQKAYWATAGEMIFSYGDVDAGPIDVTPVVRWSPFLNVQGQYHYNFSDKVGIYTGLGVRNVGLISRMNFIDTSDGSAVSKEARVKERSYSLGLPLALTLGNVNNGTHVSIGAEAELMFAYKRKIFVDDSKSKYSSWFSNNVNLFNPSAFVELNFNKGIYVRFKYYLLDFLNYQGIEISGTDIPTYGMKSPLFYISIGSADIIHEFESQNSSKPKQGSAYFKSGKKDQKNFAAASSF